ncbi:MAG: plasmid pRiA4b ORF-3 family protein [Deltaproteobacteria bacterium]|nr:plasmid pRiA4b ORF-3 family protein [Deltaproteobacteria bacterium]
MATKKQSQNTQIYQLKISLAESAPPIWRRVQVPSVMLLGDLHALIQIAMGWQNSHMHQFRVGKTCYGPLYPDDFDGVTETKDEDKVTVEEVLPKVKAKLGYEYDFGDGWEHEIVVEKILSPEQGVKYPLCLDGKRACPPEDCGGIWGYANMLEVIKDPEHPEYEEMEEWLGEEFDPDAFSVEAVNKMLRKVR